MPSQSGNLRAQNDYLYAAARIHALEKQLLTKEQLQKLIDTPKGTEHRLLTEFGYPKGENTSLSERIELRLIAAYETAAGTVADDSIFDALRYPYDASNLKAALKCALRHGFHAEDYFSPLGTVAAEDVLRAVDTGDYAVFPAKMGAAAKEAMTAYAENRDPTGIDRLLDIACFADMAEAASASGVEVLRAYISLRADMLNTVLRLRAPATVFSSYFLPGGTVPCASLMALADGTLSASAFGGTALSPLSARIAQTEDAVALELLFDSYLTEVIRPCRHAYFDASPLIGYLLAAEAEARNVRVILSSRDEGMSAERIKERMRELYV